MSQYKESDMTPFFPADAKPERHGVYERNDKETEMFDGTPAYSYWDGQYWGNTCASIIWASVNRTRSNYPELPWRGLRFDPAKGAA